MNQPETKRQRQSQEVKRFSWPLNKKKNFEIRDTSNETFVLHEETTYKVEPVLSAPYWAVILIKR